VEESFDDPLPDQPWWINACQSVQPTGWALRAAFRDRWLRIHSLTDSKRYPTTAWDWSELRERHRHATSLLLTEGERGFLISPWACASHKAFSASGLRPSRHVPEYQPDDQEPPGGPFHACSFCWSFDSFIPILDAVAEDATCALFASADASRIYAPYDGGADLFTTDPAQLTTLRMALKTYLSPRSDGL
jgi:hypothetical protein